MRLSKKLRRGLRAAFSAIMLGLLCLSILETVVFVSENMIRPPLEDLENQVTDLAFHVRRTNPAHNKIKPEDIVIIDIDDASINVLGRAQLWPRAYDARIINYLAQGKPHAIGIDFLYTERDSLSPEYARMLTAKGFTNAEEVTKAMSTDAELTAAIKNAGNVYLSFYDDDANGAQISDTSTSASLRLLASKENHGIKFPIIQKPILPVKDFALCAKAVGSIAVPTMQDGTVRYYRLMQELPDSSGLKKYVANFPLYMVLDQLGVKENNVEIKSNGIQLGNAAFIPLRKDGSFRINWLGNEEKIRYISYYKVLDELVPAEYFENKYIFFGTSASGLQDLKTVPPTADKMPGVEVHAIAFLNMMNEAFFTEVTEKEALPWLAVASVLLVFIFLLTKPLLGFVVAMIMYFGERFLFELWIIPEYGVIFPITSLMILTLLTYLSAVLFTFFVRERKSRELKSAFGTYVSPEVVELIAKDPGILHLGGEKKELTVIFSDIRNFTSYSERLDPQEIVAMLNSYLSLMSETIFRHKGTIDKFIGDAIMAVFGAPIPQLDHADGACRTALDMLDDLKEFNKLEVEKGRLPIRIGIGVNTGDMTVGNIGSSKRFDYTVIGDAVNLGSRLEGLTKFFGVDVIISETTKNACKSLEFVYRELGAVMVKGKNQHINVFELLRRNTVDDSQFASQETWLMALKSMRMKDLETAIIHLNRYIELRPGDLTTQYYLKQCSSHLEDPANFSLIMKMETK